MVGFASKTQRYLSLPFFSNIKCNLHCRFVFTQDFDHNWRALYSGNVHKIYENFGSRSEKA